MLVEVTRLVAQVAQLQLRLLAHAGRIEVGQDVGATSAANWLAHQTSTTRPTLRRAARLAKRLDEAYPEADAALAGGRAGDAGPGAGDRGGGRRPPRRPRLGDHHRQGEGVLLARAAEHDARALRILGRRLLEVLDPEAADREEARRLRGEEEEARATASFTMAATVVVTVSIESLMGGLTAAELCDESRISAGEARRLACTAGIISVVLGGPSEPLHVGRHTNTAPGGKVTFTRRT